MKFVIKSKIRNRHEW